MLAVRRNMAILAFTSMIMLIISGLFMFPSSDIWQYFFNGDIRYSSVFYRKLITSIILFIVAMIKIFKVDKIEIPKIKRRWILIIASTNIALAILITWLSVLMRYVRYA